LDDILEVDKFPEDEGNNGLQVKGKDNVERVGLAVDACEYVFEEAKRRSVDMLIVHHGLLWGSVKAIDEVLRQRLKKLICNDISLYASHLPLDYSPKYGNNILLMKAIGADKRGEFGEYHGRKIGYWGEVEKPLSLSEFSRMVERILNTKCYVLDRSKKVRRVGVISGRGWFGLREAAGLIDTLLTGEISHAAYTYSEETNTNVVFAGHYATETLGVKALGEELERKFNIETEFIEHPTGL
jgi:dinuclear metal center YbgI/SA1388 family protein